MRITTRKQEVLTAAVLAVAVTAVVAIAVVAGAKTIGDFIAGAGTAIVVIFIALTNKKLQRVKRK
jgi:multisubunit Na+/H+ antiporter MnhB subunit